MHGRVDTIDANGNPIFFDVLLGADLLPQYFGHAESGNTAAVIKLDGNQHTFRALSLGHIFSISPECIDDRLVIEFTPPGRVLHDPQRVVLGDGSRAVHVPGGSLVTIESDPGALLVDERVGTRDVGKRRGLTRNVPEVTDLIHRTPFIKHSHPLAQYLQEGETLIDDGFVPEDLHYDYSLYTVANPTLGPTDRVFLEIRGEGDDVCYIGPEPMHIEVLSGTGILRTMSLDDPRASIQSHNGPCESWGVESELRPGMVVDIEPNTRVQYLAKRGPLILRDTTLGFEEHYELPTERYFASRGALHGPVSGISLDR